MPAVVDSEFLAQGAVGDEGFVEHRGEKHNHGVVVALIPGHIHRHFHPFVLGLGHPAPSLPIYLHPPILAVTITESFSPRELGLLNLGLDANDRFRAVGEADPGAPVCRGEKRGFGR